MLAEIPDILHELRQNANQIKRDYNQDIINKEIILLSRLENICFNNELIISKSIIEEVSFYFNSIKSVPNSNTDMTVNILNLTSDSLSLLLKGITIYKKERENEVYKIIKKLNILNEYTKKSSFDLMSNHINKEQINENYEKINNSDSILDDNLFNIMIEEVTGFLDEMEDDLLKLESDFNNTDLINEIYRKIHTIKGSTGPFNYSEDIVTLAHKMEETLNDARENRVKINSNYIDVFFETIDVINEIFQIFITKQKSDIDITDILDKLNNVDLMKTDSPDSRSRNKKIKNITNLSIEQEKTLRIDIEKLDYFLNNIGCLNTTNLRMNNQITNYKYSLNKSSKIRRKIVRYIKYIKSELKGNTLQIKNLNKMIKLLFKENRILDQNFEELSETSSSINNIISELKNTAVKIRLIPVIHLFNRMKRIVRDVAKTLSKDVELVLMGTDTQIDKRMLDELYTPLVHIIRNSIDHGIESPSERIKKGKSEHGRIILNAFHLKGNIYLEIEDDGRGLDLEKIRKTCVSRNIYNEMEIKNIPDEKIINCIFNPGFTTTTSCSSISGRGVGMDVVSNTLNKLRGEVKINTNYGEGTKIIFKLPLTLIISKIFLFRLTADIYGIEFQHILSLDKINKNEIILINDNKYIEYKNQIIPIVDLKKLMELDEETFSDDMLPVIIISNNNKALGLIVDEYINIEEVILRNLGSHIKKVNNISGAAITSSGEVSLLLDIKSIFNKLNYLFTK